MAHPRFSACLDVGHAYINSSRPLEECIKGLNKNIGYVRLHNNYGTQGSHSGLLTGSIDMSSVLELLKEYAPAAKWSLETKLEEIEKSVLWLDESGYLR